MSNLSRAVSNTDHLSTSHLLAVPALPGIRAPASVLQPATRANIHGFLRLPLPQISLIFYIINEKLLCRQVPPHPLSWSRWRAVSQTELIIGFQSVCSDSNFILSSPENVHITSLYRSFTFLSGSHPAFMLLSVSVQSISVGFPSCVAQYNKQLLTFAFPLPCRQYEEPS